MSPLAASDGKLEEVRAFFNYLSALRYIFLFLIGSYARARPLRGAGRPDSGRHTDCARAHAVRPLSTRVTKETRRTVALVALRTHWGMPLCERLRLREPRVPSTLFTTSCLGLSAF
jgi:hypothetical protein